MLGAITAPTAVLIRPTDTSPGSETEPSSDSLLRAAAIGIPAWRVTTALGATHGRDVGRLAASDAVTS